jgi:hypothetical protein
MTQKNGWRIAGRAGFSYVATVSAVTGRCPSLHQLVSGQGYVCRIRKGLRKHLQRKQDVSQAVLRNMDRLSGVIRTACE